MKDYNTFKSDYDDVVFLSGEWEGDTLNHVLKNKGEAYLKWLCASVFSIDKPVKGSVINMAAVHGFLVDYEIPHMYEGIFYNPPPSLPKKKMYITANNVLEITLGNDGLNGFCHSSVTIGGKEHPLILNNSTNPLGTTKAETDAILKTLVNMKVSKGNVMAVLDEGIAAFPNNDDTTMVLTSFFYIGDNKKYGKTTKNFIADTGS
jgi:hypothetical protein